MVHMGNPFLIWNPNGRREEEDSFWVFPRWCNMKYVCGFHFGNPNGLIIPDLETLNERDFEVHFAFRILLLHHDAQEFSLCVSLHYLLLLPFKMWDDSISVFTRRLQDVPDVPDVYHSVRWCVSTSTFTSLWYVVAAADERRQLFHERIFHSSWCLCACSWQWKRVTRWWENSVSFNFVLMILLPDSDSTLWLSDCRPSDRHVQEVNEF